ncbi:uncharacterized protein LOC142625367 [Castanea sativa]|uniref:uncharacterized protein LOC142625367 n=1 Tax=Castanea sativa TaxID=21020 RepID=UPI003F6509A3
MSLHTHNDALMCKVFPSSLGPTALRWFNELRKGSMHSFAELIQEFGIPFMTCSRVPQLVDALLFLKMGAEKLFATTLAGTGSFIMKLVGGNEKIAAITFWLGLPKDSELRESLTKRPPEDMRQLMRRIEEYKWLEDNRLQNKGKAPVVSNPRQGSFQSRPRKELRIQELEVWVGEVNVLFKKSVLHKIVDRIKHEPYFRWPNKMGVTRQEEIRTCTIHTTNIRGTPPSNAGC